MEICNQKGEDNMDLNEDCEEDKDSMLGSHNEEAECTSIREENLNENWNENQNENSNEIKEEKSLASLYNNFTNCKTAPAYSFILPIAYFITSLTFTFLIPLICGFKSNSSPSDLKQQHLSFIPTFYSVRPPLFNFGVVCLSIVGLINVWFYCSIVLQRFSVPEFQSKKLGIHTMFIMGILANTMYIFFGYSSNILKIEKVKIKDIRIPLSIIIFLTFIFFNILFSVFSIFSIHSLTGLSEGSNSKSSAGNMKRQLKNRRYIVCLAIFVMLIYISAIAININYRKRKSLHKTKLGTILQNLLFFLPYLLYLINSFMNLSYYADIIYVQENLAMIIDKEYFDSNCDDNSVLIIT